MSDSMWKGAWDKATEIADTRAATITYMVVAVVTATIIVVWGLRKLFGKDEA